MKAQEGWETYTNTREMLLGILEFHPRSLLELGDGEQSALRAYYLLDSTEVEAFESFAALSTDHELREAAVSAVARFKTNMGVQSFD